MSKKQAKSDHLYRLLCTQLVSKPECQGKISTHIKTHFKHETLPAYEGNGGSEEEKCLLYQSCIAAVDREDFSLLYVPVVTIPQPEPVTQQIPIAVPSEPHPETAVSDGVWYPNVDNTHIMKPEHERLLELLEKKSDLRPQNVILAGPTGCGKTTTGIQFAARFKRPLLVWNCATVREMQEWFGYQYARDGSTGWHTSLFVRAVEAGNHCIVLDEINRVVPSIVNTLFGILDEQRETYLDKANKKIKVGKRTVFIATINEGNTYTGTSVLDEAVRSRFTRRIEFNFMDEKDEIKVLTSRTNIDNDTAKKLVQLSGAIRLKSIGLGGTLTSTISTRHLLAAADDFTEVGHTAFIHNIANHFSPDGADASERFQVMQMMVGKGLISGAEANVPEATKAKAKKA